MDAHTSASNRLKKPNYSFTCIVNALLRDANISLKAKGLYSVMFSKPNDWVFYEEALVKESRDGRDSVRAGLDELEKAGWLSRTQSREKGTFGHTVFELHTVAGKPVNGKSVAGKPAAIKTDLINTESTNPPPPKGEPDEFEEIWKAKWSRGEIVTHNKHRAYKAYKAALKRGLKPADLLGWVKSLAGVSKPGTEFAPMLSTWLNEERWKDTTGAAAMSPADLKAVEERLAESKRRHDEDMQRLVEAKSAELRGAA